MRHNIPLPVLPSTELHKQSSPKQKTKTLNLLLSVAQLLDLPSRCSKCMTLSILETSPDILS